MDVEFLRYKYEDGYSGVLTKYKFKIGIRHVQMLYMLASSVSLGLVRGSTGIAVLAINDETRQNDTYIQVHNWDKRIQGAVLSSFFFGYALTLIPAHLYLRRIGGKLILTLILAVNGALCVAMPTIVNKGGWVAACNAQLFMGMSHGCFSSVYEALLERWAPPNENTVFGSLLYGGIQLGIIIALPVAGLLSQLPLGWELIYYSLAMITLPMAVVIGTLTASSPEEHRAIGDEEKEYIKEARSLYQKKSLQRPWRRILMSAKFWAIAFVHVASNTLFVFYLVIVPVYLTMQGLDINTSAFHSAIPFTAMWAAYLITACSLDWMLNFGCMDYIFSMTHFRKLINAFGIADVGRKTARLKWDWAGHVARMHSERWAKAITEWVPDGRRPRGRPKKRWRDDLDAFEPLWIVMALDRGKWKERGETFAQQWDDTGAFGVIIALTMLPSLDGEWPCTIVLTAVLASLGFQLSGFLNTYKDMSENFAGTLLTMTSAFSSMIGAAVPFVCGLILNDDYTDLKRWRVVYLTLASIYAVCNVIYIAFGSSRRQEWDYEHGRKIGHYNCVIDVTQVQLDDFSRRLFRDKFEHDTAF